MRSLMIILCKITAESDCERTLKIGQNLPKLWATIVFFSVSEAKSYIFSQKILFLLLCKVGSP